MFKLFRMSWQVNVLGFTAVELTVKLDWHSGAKHHRTLTPPTGCGGRNKSVKSHCSFLIYCRAKAQGDSCGGVLCRTAEFWNSISDPKNEWIHWKWGARKQGVSCRSHGTMPTSSTARPAEGSPVQEVFSMRSQQVEVFCSLFWGLMLKEHNYWNI